MGNKDGVAAVVGFGQIVLESGTAGAMADDPAFLIVVDIAELVDGVIDNALAAGASGVVKFSVPGVPLDEKNVAIHGNRLAAPIPDLIRGKHAKLLVAGIMPAVDQEDIVSELRVTFINGKQQHDRACNHAKDS